MQNTKLKGMTLVWTPHKPAEDQMAYLIFEARPGPREVLPHIMPHKISFFWKLKNTFFSSSWATKAMIFQKTMLIPG